DGLRVSSSGPEHVVDRIAELPLDAILTAELAPLVTIRGPLNEQIAAADARLVAMMQVDPHVRLLATAPGVGPVTATAFVATIDDITRFHSPHELEAYLGLVPGEWSSGEKRRLGAITKAGNTQLRWLLVEASWGILRSKSLETVALRRWTLRIAARRGKSIAAVALARRLAGILYAMWRDGTPYDARKIRLPSPPVRQTGQEVTRRAS
ncbi:MAG: IS110 family transposase, partial [Gemmatimonadaceae bacterium]